MVVKHRKTERQLGRNNARNLKRYETDLPPRCPDASGHRALSHAIHICRKVLKILFAERGSVRELQPRVRMRALRQIFPQPRRRKRARRVVWNASQECVNALHAIFSKRQNDFNRKIYRQAGINQNGMKVIPLIDARGLDREAPTQFRKHLRIFFLRANEIPLVPDTATSPHRTDSI